MMEQVLIDYVNRSRCSKEARLAYLEEHVVSAKLGIIKDIMDILPDHGDPPIYSAGSAMTDTSRFIPLQCNQRNGGAGMSRAEARLASMGEGIERYCSAFYTKDDLLFGAYGDFEGTAIEPERFQLFHDRQYNHPKFPYTRFTRNTRIAWTRAYSLTSQREVLIPACFVYMPYAPTKDEALIGPGISTGLSCGDDLLSSIVTGINECVERDAFVITWLHQLPVPVLDLSEDPYFSELLKTTFLADRISYTVLDVTLDIPLPSVFVLARGDSTYGPLFCVGSATRAEYKPAIEKCLVETAQGRPFIRYLLRARSDWNIDEGFQNLQNFDDHALVYTKMPELVEKIELIREPQCRTRKTKPSAEYKGLSLFEIFQGQIRAFREKGYEIIVKDLTTRDVHDFGLRVVKVLCPDLCQLHGNHNLKFFGGNRLYEVPYRLGLTDRVRVLDELSPYPHPFP